MKSTDLKNFLSKNKMSQGDLCRLIYESSTINDRNIVSRWCNGVSKVPRWLPNFLKIYERLTKKNQIDLFED